MNPGDVGHAVMIEKDQLEGTSTQHEYRFKLSEGFKGVKNIHILESRFKQRYKYYGKHYEKVDEMYEILVIGDIGSKKQGDLLAKVKMTAIEWLNNSGYRIVSAGNSDVDVDTGITADLL